ncbi:MAG: Ribosomal RNA small subunit methyltransferase E [Chlamydiae bacterium]|nr:Ribosomal RNA small subunit methyltransferase E [Chlamydiota bacterium]
MPHDRFYIDTPLSGEVTLEGEEFRHLNRVMRKKGGDSIELVNGRGVLALGKILTTTRRDATIEIIKTEMHEPAIPPLILIQALPKLPLLELIIQKGTELGVSHFYLYASSHSEKKDLSPNQLKRLDHILISAMKQCGRLDLPKIEMGFPTLEIPLFFGDLSEDAPLLSQRATLPAALAIGPGQGFTEKELEELRSRGQGVRLAPYTLRTETAAIAGLSLLANTHS